MQQSVQPHNILGYQHIINFYIGIYTSAGSQSEKFEGVMCALKFFFFQINIHQSIQFVHHNVDILSTDSCRHYRDFFAAQSTGVGIEFSFVLFDFDFVKIFRDFRNPVRVANKNYFLCKIFR